MRALTIDGKQLSYRGTGLALVTAEYLRAFSSLGHEGDISVIVDESVDLSFFDLSDLSYEWLRVPARSPGLGLAARAFAVHDYAERFAWASQVVRLFGRNPGARNHFIPYFFNYGDLNANVVLVPDLIWRMLPAKAVDDPRRSWLWNARHKLPFRELFQRQEEARVAGARSIVVYSEFVRGQVHDMLGIPLERIHMIPLATPSWVEKLYDPAAVQEVRERHRLPERFVLYVGGFGTRKNIPMLIRACARLHRQDADFRLVLAGLSERMLESALGLEIREALADEHAGQAVVRLDFVPPEELATIYGLCEFCVYPSMGEGFGLPVLEAAAAQKLCLCGDNTSLPEVQTNPAYRIDSNDESAWIERIGHFWRNSQAAGSAGQDSRALCDRYSWTASASKLWAVLRG